MWLQVGDLHLTDKARDEYRFGIFDWIRQQQTKRDVAATFLAGDLTESKDRHSATLVNKIVTGLTSLKPPIYICMGNHDYRSSTSPFFGFLNYIKGIDFVTVPKTANCIRNIAIIPHCHEEAHFLDSFKHTVSKDVHGALVHQTFNGAMAETGTRLNGFSASLIESAGLPLGVYAGDVHRPQRHGKVTYIGAPYHVRFGDDYNPRCIWVDKDGKNHNLYFDAPFKWSLKINGEYDLEDHGRLAAGDQIKLTVNLNKEELVDWKSIKANILNTCRTMKLEVYSINVEVETSNLTKKLKATGQDHERIFNEFCQIENVAKNIQSIGTKFISGR